MPYEAYDYAGYPEPWTQHYGTPVAELTHEVEEYHEDPIVQPYEVHSEISMGDYQYPEDLHDTYTTVDHAEDKFWEAPAAETHHFDDWSYQYADPYQQPVDESVYEQHYDHHYAEETAVVGQDDWSYPEDTYAEAAYSYAEPEEAYSYADAEAYSYADPEDAFSFADYQLPQAETIEETHFDGDHFDGDYYGADDVYGGYSREEEDVYDAADYAGYDYADYADYAGYADGGYADEFAAGYTDAEPAIPLSDIKYDQPMGGAYDELAQ